MITSWDQLELVFDAHRLAELMDIDVETVYRRCSPRMRGTKLEMRPAPVSWERPYRWYREHVKAFVEKRAALPKVRRGGTREAPLTGRRTSPRQDAVPA